LLIGVTLGSLAGYVAGVVDALISRLTDLVMAFPLLLFLAMVGSVFINGITRWTFGGLLNQGVFQLIVIIGAFTWFYPARIARTQIQALRQREFVEAAQMVGARDSRIMRTHLLPHLVPHNPATTQPWLTLCPSLAIFATVFALKLFGEGLREATDPRTVR
jgi:peptide/nickel transport system permease protein